MTVRVSQIRRVIVAKLAYCFCVLRICRQPTFRNVLVAEGHAIVGKCHFLQSAKFRELRAFLSKIWNILSCHWDTHYGSGYG